MITDPALQLGVELFIWFVIALASATIILCLMWIWICKKNHAERLRCCCAYYLNGKCIKDKQKCYGFSWNCPKINRRKDVC